MKIGIYSDIHANMEALDAVLEAMEKEGVERRYCLGDLVGYGPEPNECITKIKSNGDATIAGNHDKAAIDRQLLKDFNKNAALALQWTRGVLTSESIEFLKGLDLEIRWDNASAVHATPDEPGEWLYIMRQSDISRNLAVQTTAVCFIGHSHVPIVFVLDDKKDILIPDASEVRLQKDWKYLINVGSVGQPRDGDPRAAYGILDTDDHCFRLKRVSYAVEHVQKKMKEKGLPELLIRRLELGE